MTKYWSEAQHLAAAWFAPRGWPHARAVGSGRQGADVENMAGLAPEVKAETGWRPTLWLRQAESHGGLPFVIWRPHGFGPASIAKWPVIMTLETATALLRAAGYGDDDESA